jgi:hypothetical protein
MCSLPSLLYLWGSPCASICSASRCVCVCIYVFPSRVPCPLCCTHEGLCVPRYAAIPGVCVFVYVCTCVRVYVCTSVRVYVCTCVFERGCFGKN